MKSFRADYVFPVYADPIKNGVVTIDDHGRIISVSDIPPPNVKLNEVEHLKGALCPGFINTHCHLELSYLKDKLSQGKGLINFIREIQSLRNADNATILKAAEKADKDMYENGIVAVGDISNSNVSVAVKAKSNIYYHTFVEAFSFMPDKAQSTFDKAISLLGEFKNQSASITPHAPYSVSKELFRLIKKYSDTNLNLISVHNQETEEENKFYRYRLGGFLDLYDHFGMDISYFKSQARNSLQSILPLLSSKQDILFVHNTYTNLKDIYFLKRFDRKVHFCFCPGANQYIESRLPKIDLFVDQGFNITLGTDSLASNTKLSILHEMHLIQEKFPAIGLQKLIEWGTINGARYLGVSDEKGTLEAGKTPGLNLITGLDGLKITADSKVKRLC